MKRIVLVFTSILLALICCLTSCSNKQVEEDSTAEETTTATPSTSSTSNRYDYFSANVLESVTIRRDVYASMTIELPKSLLVTDKDVKNYELKLRFDHRTAVNGTTEVKDQPLTWGDTANIYYRGTVDGVEFSGGSNMDASTPYALGLGSSSFVDGFEEALIGVVPQNTSKDQPVEVHVVFPDDYKDELAGKSAIFYVYVVSSIQYNIPDYDRTFIVDTLMFGKDGGNGYETDEALFEAFDAYIKSYLEKQNESTLTQAKTSYLWTYLVENSTVSNLPQSEIDYYYDAYLSEIDYYYDYFINEGYSFDSKDSFACLYLGLDEGSDWKECEKTRSLDQVRRDMIYHAIAEQEGIESVSDEDFNSQVNYWVDYYSYYGVTAQDVIENMGEVFLKEEAFSENMLNYLLEHTTFTYAS